VGDLDGDGDLDVIHTVDRPGTNEIRWHRNLFPVHVTGRFLDRSGDGVFMRGEPGLLEVSMCNLTGNTYTDIQIETLPQSDAIELEATQTTIDMIISHETTTVLIPFTLPPSGICGESFGADLILHLPVGDSLGEAKAEIGDSGLEVIATGRNEIIPIPDNDPEGLRYTLTVPPRGSTTVNDIDFLLEIEHAHIGDLSAVLTAPNGSQEIFSSFDPEDDGTVISVNSDLPAHDGLSPEGEWTLQVIDHAPGNTGNLTRFRLQIRYRFVDCAVWGEEELLRALLGLVPTSPLMDYNGDGVIDAADVVAVLGL
jgi:subtilisin-like proprotein convertase family protein